MANPIRPGGKRAKQIAIEQRLAKIETYLIRGVTNQYQIAAGLGCTQYTVNASIKIIHDRWKKQSEGTNAKAIRTKQLENILRLALDGYDRSKRDEEEFVIQERPCFKCHGEGKMEDLPGKFKDCLDCLGKGKIVSETTKVKGKAGDSSFLNIARGVVAELAKLEGLMPTKALVSQTTNTLIEMGSDGIGDRAISRKVTELFYEAPEELILQSMSLIDRVKVAQRAKEVVEIPAETVIEVEAENVTIEGEVVEIPAEKKEEGDIPDWMYDEEDVGE